MSALPPKADIAKRELYARIRPRAAAHSSCVRQVPPTRTPVIAISMTGRFVAPKILAVNLNDGGTRELAADKVFLNVGAAPMAGWFLIACSLIPRSPMWG